MEGRFSVSIESQTAPSDSDFVRQKLSDYNVTFAGSDNHEPLNVIARDPGGAICAGLLGGTYWGWLYVSILWVREDLRSQGIGSRLLTDAEVEAVRRGCRHSHLDTFDFQAPDFYRRRGYVVFGVQDDLPPGHQRIYLRKDLPLGGGRSA